MKYSNFLEYTIFNSEKPQIVIKTFCAPSDDFAIRWIRDCSKTPNCVLYRTRKLLKIKKLYEVR